MPLPTGPILIAGATAAIGWFFQNQSDKIANKRHLREAEFSRAQKISEELIMTLDKVYYYLRHGAMHVALRKQNVDPGKKDERSMEVAQTPVGAEPDRADAETWSGFERAALNWGTNKTRFDCEVLRYFGEENYKRLRELQEGIEAAKSTVTGTYYNRPSGVVTKDEETGEKWLNKSAYNEYWKVLRRVENELLELGKYIIKGIQDQNVGSLRKD